jgi:hypothetical protein
LAARLGSAAAAGASARRRRQGLSSSAARARTERGKSFASSDFFSPRSALSAFEGNERSWSPLRQTAVFYMGPANVWKFNVNKKFGGKWIMSYFIKFRKFGEIQKKSTQMQLMSERNMNFLKTWKSAEFAELSVELADNSVDEQ